MFSNFLSFLILFSATASVFCLTKVPCQLTDDVCVTAAANDYYRRIAPGLPDHGVESLDPIHVDHIDASLPTLNYSLSDAYFHGMKTCRVDKLHFDFKQESILYLICPRLTLDSNYYFNGDIGSVFITGNGKCKVVHDDYHIGFRMNAEIVNGADGKPHLNIKSHVLDPLEVRGAVNYSLGNLYDGDKDKSESTHKFINENWKKVSVSTHEPAMNAFMGKIVERVNNSFKAFSINEIFYREV